MRSELAHGERAQRLCSGGGLNSPLPLLDLLGVHRFLGLASDAVNGLLVLERQLAIDGAVKVVRHRTPRTPERPESGGRETPTFWRSFGVDKMSSSTSGPFVRKFAALADRSSSCRR
jgi:hypothetical protein